MSIVTSQITRQRNDGGVLFVEETHIDDLGKVHILRRRVPVDYANLATDMVTHAAEMNIALAEAEAQEVLA